jgi:hypothetical protein
MINGFCKSIKNAKARRANFGLKRGATANNRKLQCHSYFLIHSPVVCKTGDPPILLLRQIHCGWCHLIFYVCRSCWRGQRYCCDGCRLAAKRKQRCEAQRRYRQTPKGKKAHCQAENRRRHRLGKKNQKNMDDASSTRLPRWCMQLFNSIRNRYFTEQNIEQCHFCSANGLVVNEFPRRGYGQRRNWT